MRVGAFYAAIAGAQCGVVCQALISLCRPLNTTREFLLQRYIASTCSVTQRFPESFGLLDSRISTQSDLCLNPIHSSNISQPFHGDGHERLLGWECESATPPNWLDSVLTWSQTSTPFAKPVYRLQSLFLNSNIYYVAYRAFSNVFPTHDSKFPRTYGVFFQPNRWLSL